MATGRTPDGRFAKGFVSLRRKPPIEKTCLECGIKFSVRPSWDRVVRCSRACANQGRISPNLGRKFGPSPKKGIPVSEETKAKLRISCGKVFGPEHHNWRGGGRSLRKQEMARHEYRTWRETVFRRDDFTCCECGVRGGSLHAHHIKPWSLFPELKFAVDNGMTLCVRCHLKTDSFPKQLIPKELRI